MQTIYVVSTSRMPPIPRDLKRRTKLLPRRVFWDTNRDRIAADELVHHTHTLTCVRTETPRDVINIKVVYYRHSSSVKEHSEALSEDDNEQSEENLEDIDDSIDMMGSSTGHECNAQLHSGPQREKELFMKARSYVGTFPYRTA